MIRTFTLTGEELAAVLWAVGNMTDGNARDIGEMIACGMTEKQARVLLRAEAKMKVTPIRKPAKPRRRTRDESGYPIDVPDDTPSLDDSFHRHEMDVD